MERPIETAQQTKSYEVLHLDRDLELYIGVDPKKLHKDGLDFVVRPEIMKMPQVNDLVNLLSDVVLNITRCEDDGDITHYYFDTETDLGPVFMKCKWDRGVGCAENFREIMATDEDALKLSPDERQEVRNQWHSRASVLSEMKLAEAIAGIVSSPEAQELAAKYGFESIEFIMPLLAIVDKQIGYRYMVFRDYGPMKAFDSRTRLHWSSLSTELEGLFGRNGITTSDLNESQLICADESSKHLYLVDAEEYRPTRPGQMARMPSLWPPIH